MSALTAKPNTTIAYTDGACKGNPGVGGWGAYLLLADGQTQELCGGDASTTNNRMELMGAIQAIEHSPIEHHLEIWTDSNYVKNGITSWIQNWKAKGWKTANKKPVANQDLWQQLDSLNEQRSISWHWVKGHAGHAGNEKADELANQGVIQVTNGNNNMTPTHSSKNTTMLNSQNEINHNDPIDWLEQDPLGFASEMSDDMANDNHDETNDIDHLDTQTNNIPDTNNTANIHQKPSFDGDTSRANPYFVPLLPKPIHRHDADRQLIMDTETTGLDAQKGDRIIEVGIVELLGRKFTGEKLHVYINPERGMDEEVIRVHGISEAFLADKPTFDKVAQQLYDFMEGAEIIAHNAAFDMGFLSMEFNKVGLTDFSQRVQVTDSLALAKQQYPGQKNTLDALVKRLNVGKQDRTFHGALLDAEILAEVYLAMTGGQVALAIDEEVPSDGGGSHTHFAHLASQLIASSEDNHAHQTWLNQLVDSYPELAQRWSF